MKVHGTAEKKVLIKTAMMLCLVFWSATSFGAPTYRDATALILRVESLQQLRTIAQKFEIIRRRMRACEIQRLRRLPPTLCYGLEVSSPGAVANVRQLDSECEIRSRSATQLPTWDEKTSPKCRAALERRAQDLQYANRDALR